MRVSIRFKNLARIRRAFNEAPDDMRRELQKAIARSTFIIGRQSRINAPVKTGRLRASHTERIFPGKGIVQPMVNYAMFVHEGTRYMRKRPFLARAVESEVDEVEREFKDAVDNVLERIGRA